MNWIDFVALSEEPHDIPADWLVERIRKWRNTSLKESDYTQIGDTPFSAAKKEEWRQYRQALRELPQQAEDPRTWVFPERPAS